MKRITKYILPLSGGLDSTFLLQSLLECGKSVVPFHFENISNFDSKYLHEKDAVNKIYKYLSDRYNIEPIKYGKLDISNIGSGFDTDKVLFFAQRLCYNLVRFDGISKIKLQFPVVMEDLVPSIKNRMTYIDGGLNNNLQGALIDSMRFIVKEQNILKIDRSIYTPLLDNNMYKKDIIKYIPKDLLELTQSCRKNLDAPCGKCYACKRHAAALNGEIYNGKN